MYKLCSNHFELYFILGSQDVKDPERVLEEALVGGITFFQYREKKLSWGESVKFGQTLLRCCRKYNVPFIVNDSVELAIEIGADGVHLGQSDGSLSDARKILGSDKIIGASCHNVKEALDAISSGVDYFGVGAMFPTISKSDVETQNIDIIRDIRQVVGNFFFVGIGGITEQNLDDVILNGADGVAIISDIARSTEPREKASRIREKIKQLKRRKMR